MDYPWPEELHYDFMYALHDPEEATTAEAAPGGVELPTLPEGSVAEVLHVWAEFEGEEWHPGESAGRELSMCAVVKLTDGQFASVSASTDYTGWGCQSGSDVRIGTLSDVIKYGLDKEDRARFGYTEES